MRNMIEERVFKYRGAEKAAGTWYRACGAYSPSGEVGCAQGGREIKAVLLVPRRAHRRQLKAWAPFPARGCRIYDPPPVGSRGLQTAPVSDGCARYAALSAQGTLSRLQQAVGKARLFYSGAGRETT